MTIRINTLIIYTVLLFSKIAMCQYPVSSRGDNSWGYKNPQTDSILIKDLSLIKPFNNGIGIICKTNKWGAVNTEMNLIIPFKYDELKFLCPNVIQAKKKDYFLLLDSLGKKIVKQKLYDIAVLPNTTHITIQNKLGNYAIINQGGTFITPYKFASPPSHLFHYDLMVTEKKGNLFYSGVINELGHQIIPNNYLFIKKIERTYYRCQDITNTVWYYDFLGKEVYKGGVEEIYFVDTNAIVVKNDTNQKLILKSNQAEFYAEEWKNTGTFYYATLNTNQTQFVFTDGRSDIKEGKWWFGPISNEAYLTKGPNGFGLSNTSGQLILDPIYERIYAWNTEMAVVTLNQNGKHKSIINLKSTKVIFSGTYDLIDFLPCHQFITIKGDYGSILDHNFETVDLKNSSNITHYFIPSDTKVKLKRSFFYKSNKKYITSSSPENPNCDAIHISTKKLDNYEMLADNYGNNPIPDRVKVRTRTEHGQRMGLLDFEGKIIIPLNYAVISSHQNGFIPVAISDTVNGETKRIWGILDLNGKKVIVPTYDRIDRIHQGVALTVNNGLYSMLNLQSKKEIATGYSHIRHFENNLFLVTINQNYGLLNLKGEVIAKPIYEQINYLKKDNIYIAKRNGITFRLDVYGNEYPIK